MAVRLRWGGVGPLVPCPAAKAQCPRSSVPSKRRAFKQPHLRKARAMATRCFSPPLSFSPRSPTTVSQPAHLRGAPGVGTSSSNNTRDTQARQQWTRSSGASTDADRRGASPCGMRATAASSLAAAAAACTSRQVAPGRP